MITIKNINNHHNHQININIINLKTPMKNSISINFQLQSRIKEEGINVKTYRCVGSEQYLHLDPWLMVEEFDGQYPDGFPDHPHRGIETISYIFSGSVEHEDFNGNRGKIKVGQVQRMTAGRGIVHSEMPGDKWLKTRCTGLQVWLNLRHNEKFCESGYQQLKQNQIPTAQLNENVKITIIAGSFEGLVSPLITKVPIIYLNAEIKEESEWELDLNPAFNYIIYIVEGRCMLGSDNTLGLKRSCNIIYQDKDLKSERMIKIKTMEEASRVIILGGEPIGDPIFKRGPFVMTSESELEQCLEDYLECKNGFERNLNWKSKISKHLTKNK